MKHHTSRHHKDETSRFRDHMRSRTRNKKIAKTAIFLAATAVAIAVMGCVFFAYYIDK